MLQLLLLPQVLLLLLPDRVLAEAWPVGIRGTTFANPSYPKPRIRSSTWVLGRAAPKVAAGSLAGAHLAGEAGYWSLGMLLSLTMLCCGGQLHHLLLCRRRRRRHRLRG